MIQPSRRAAGILPDPVIKDSRASGFLFFITLSPALDASGVQQWLRSLDTALSTLRASTDGSGQPVASAVVAFGPAFFGTSAQPRFGLPADRIPAGLAAGPVTISQAKDAGAGQHDVLLYVMATSDAAVADFEKALAAGKGTAITVVGVERGYQRLDGREPTGFPDGLRNVASDRRAAVVFVDPDEQGEEPVWTEGGSYLSYLKVSLDLNKAASMSVPDQERMMGRRKADGSRLDLPAGTGPTTEGDFTDGANPPPGSHIRKAGPRGDEHDRVEIFRRGIPYATLMPDGTFESGLQFVSFQSSVDNFLVVLQRWMLNTDFPVAGTGVDALFATGVAAIEKGGVYFVPPTVEGTYVGQVVFGPDPPDPCHASRVFVRKRILDTNGNAVMADLGGFAFNVLDPNGTPLTAQFITDPAGHAVSTEIDALAHPTVILREGPPPQGLTGAGDVAVVLDKRRVLVRVDNHATPGTPGYGH